jgi:hypothetical protein
MASRSPFRLTTYYNQFRQKTEIPTAAYNTASMENRLSSRAGYRSFERCRNSGATGADIARRVTVGSVATIAVGSAIGLGLGLTSERYIGELLYQVKATDPNLLAVPLITLLGVAVLAAVPPVLRSIYLDPGQILRSE